MILHVIRFNEQGFDRMEASYRYLGVANTHGTCPEMSKSKFGSLSPRGAS